MPLPSLQDIEAAAQVVYRDFAPTPQYRWATSPTWSTSVTCWKCRPSSAGHGRGRRPGSSATGR